MKTKRTPFKTRLQKWPEVFALAHVVCPKCGGRLKRIACRKITDTHKRIEHWCPVCEIRVDAISRPSEPLK